MYIINESGLYSLVLSSKLPGAKKFRRWVTAEVLPSIRRHGLYAVDQLIENPDLAIQAFSALKEEREKRKVLEAEREANRPKVLFADSVAASNTSILVGELAKLLKQNGVDTGQNRLFDWMRNNGYLIRREGTDYNMPTQRSMELGLFEIKETSITHADGHVTVCLLSICMRGRPEQRYLLKDTPHALFCRPGSVVKAVAQLGCQLMLHMAALELLVQHRLVMEL